MRVRRSVRPRGHDAANPGESAAAYGRAPHARISWRAGAVEIPLPFVRQRSGVQLPEKATRWKPLRPALIAIFLTMFAALGMGFSGLDDPPTAFAPGTPQTEVAIVRVAQEHVTPTGRAVAAWSLPEPPHGGAVMAASLDPSATAAASQESTATAEPTATATEEPAVAAAEIPTATPTAAPPTATPEPRPAPSWVPYPQTQLTEAELRAAATQAGWPAELQDQLVAVAWCESSFRPNASNRFAYGIMQLVPAWFDYAGEDFASWMDPVVNLRVAYRVYAYDIDRGHDPWSQWICGHAAASIPDPTPTPTPTTTSTPLPWPESSATAADASGEVTATPASE